MVGIVSYVNPGRHYFAYPGLRLNRPAGASYGLLFIFIKCKSKNNGNRKVYYALRF